MSSILPYHRDVFFAPIQDVFDNFYDDFFTKSFDMKNFKEKSSFPKWDVFYTDNEFVVEASIPGITKEDLTIEVEEEAGGNRLMISGKMRKENDFEKNSFSCREIRRAAFSRQLYLPVGVRGDPIASLKDGILTLKWQLAKKQEVKRNVKKIAIPE